MLPVILLLLLSCEVHAQSTFKTVGDKNNEAARKSRLETIKSVDFSVGTKEDFYRKIERVLDLDLPANKVLSSVVDSNGQEYSIIDLLFNLAINEGVKAMVDPEHVEVLRIEQIERYKKIVDTVTVFTVNKLLFQEQWQYDKEIRKMIVRITHIAIAYEAEDHKLKSLFWLPYQEIRKVSQDYIIKDKVKTMSGRKKRLSLKDYFDLRYFESHIVRVSN